MDDTKYSELFSLGTLVMTEGVREKVPLKESWDALIRHLVGDWGDLSEKDWALNDEALVNGSRLMSVYQTSSGIRFWIITEWDRSVTTLLLPNEY